MDIQNLIPVEWSNQRVLTSAQLAQAYGCSPRNISDNFNRVKEQFTEGVHYFKLDGLVLRSFREYSEKIGLVIPLNTPRLYLWTYQGCVRHCKMINTLEAWKIFDELEKVYFNIPLVTPVVIAPAAKSAKVKNPKRVAGQLTPAGVYVSLMHNETFKFAVVKVGQSSDVEKRTKEVARQYGLKHDKSYKTALLPRNVALLIEKALKDIFAPSKVEKEFFTVEFEEADRIIKALEKLFVDLSKIYNFEHDDKVLKIAEKILVESVNLLNDKRFISIADKKK